MIEREIRTTQRKGLVTARVGQGYYRQQILKNGEGNVNR